MESDPASAQAPPVTAHREFSVALCLAGVGLLALCWVAGLISGYFIAWGVSEGEGTPATRSLAWLVLLALAGYVIAGAPLLWRRTRSIAGRAAVLGPHAALIAVGVIGLLLR